MKPCASYFLRLVRTPRSFVRHGICLTASPQENATSHKHAFPYCTHTHTWRCGFARAKNHSATEKRRKVKFLLLFFFFSLRAPLMCPADSETGFGRRCHRRRQGSQPRWPPNIRAKRRLRWKWNGLSPDERAARANVPFLFSPQSDTITIIIGVAPQTEISFGDQLLASVCPTDSICVCRRRRRRSQGQQAGWHCRCH